MRRAGKGKDTAVQSPLREVGIRRIESREPANAVSGRDQAALIPTSTLWWSQETKQTTFSSKDEGREKDEAAASSPTLGLPWEEDCGFERGATASECTIDGRIEIELHIALQEGVQQGGCSCSSSNYSEMMKNGSERRFQ